MNSPFDSAKYKALLEGLEVAEVHFSQLNDELRFEAEYHRKRFLTELVERSRYPSLDICDFSDVSDGQHGYHQVDERSSIWMLTAKNAKGWLADTEGADHIAEWVDINNRRSSLAEDDLILSTRGTVGLCALVTAKVLPANIDQDIARIALHSDSPLLPEYVLAYLNSSYGQDYMTREASGMVQQGLSLAKVRRIPIPQLTSDLQHAVRNSVRSALLSYWSSSTLFESAENILLTELGLHDWQPPEPLSYERKASECFVSARIDAEYYQPSVIQLIECIQQLGCFALRKHADVTNGYPWESAYFVDCTQTGEPFVRIRDCKPGVFDVDELDRLANPYVVDQGQQKTRTGDILVGMDGLKWFYGGLVEDPCYVNQRVAWVRQHTDCPVSPEYMMLVINSKIGQTQLLREMTIAHTVGHITNETVRDLLIPIVNSNTHCEITEMIRSSYVARRTAKEMLGFAKRSVEIAIEQNEEAALVFLKEVER